MLTLLLTSAALLAAASNAAQAVQAGAPDAAALGRAARTASFRYESLQRRLAPATNDGGRRSDQCDERIGRFCFWYDAPSDPPDPPLPPEPPEVADARLVAVEAHRRWFSAAPDDHQASGFLIRYLVEDGRSSEAVAAARTHVWAAGRDPDALFILGLALHYAEDFVAAEAAFDSARAGMDEVRRRAVDGVEMLLERSERGRYADLPADARERYERRLWALSDPSVLQPGNERRSGHYARHAWARIHERAPRVRGKISWGDDHEEILIRFGLPVSRKRIRDFPSTFVQSDPRFIESFDPGAVALVPPALLTRGLPEAPPPGLRHELVRDTAPSSYAPVRLRLDALDVVVSRMPADYGALLRLDAVLAPDTIEPRTPFEPRALLVLMDTLGNELLREPAPTRRQGDSTVVSGRAAVPPGEWVYRVEVLDDSTALAGLAQYRVSVPFPGMPLRAEDAVDTRPGFTLSDLIVAEPFGDSLPMAHDDPLLRPYPSLVLPTRTAVGLFAEARGLRREGRYAVEWSVEEQKESSILGQAARWLGRRLGLIEREEPLRVRWEDVAVGGSVPVAVNLDLADADEGLYRVRLRVTDEITGVARTAERLVRLSGGSTPAPR